MSMHLTMKGGEYMTTFNVTKEQVGGWLESPVTQRFLHVIDEDMGGELKTAWDMLLYGRKDKEELFVDRMQIQNALDIIERMKQIAEELYMYNDEDEAQGEEDETR